LSFHLGVLLVFLSGLDNRFLFSVQNYSFFQYKQNIFQKIFNNKVIIFQNVTNHLFYDKKKDTFHNMYDL